MSVIQNREEYTEHFTPGYDSGEYQTCVKAIGGSVSLTKFDTKNPPNVIYLEHNGNVSTRSVPGYLCRSKKNTSIFIRIVNLDTYDLNNLLTYHKKSDFQISKFMVSSDTSNKVVDGSIQYDVPPVWSSMEKDLWNTSDSTDYENDIYLAVKKRPRKRSYRGPKKAGSMAKRMKSNYRRKKTKRSY